MTDYVGRGSIRAARRAPLFDYLKARHPRDVIPEGRCYLRLADDHSVVVSDAYTGFIDYATGETGNAVDFLTRYLDYGFQDAVAALCEYMGTPADLQAGYLNVRDLTDYEPPDKAARTAAGAAAGPPAASRPAPPGGQAAARDPQDAEPKPFLPPTPVQGPYRQTFAYLTRRRGIPAPLIQKLVDDRILYQEAGHNNMVFIDRARTYAELRGTLTDKPFHGVVSGSDTAGFWWFKPQGPASPVTGTFICEAAIDAMSLYLIRQRLHLPPWDNPMYCSIGGAYNQQRIDAIKAVMGSVDKPAVLAVDNDDAGELCRQRNPDCHAFVPTLKDWNTDWLDMLRQPTSA